MLALLTACHPSPRGLTVVSGKTVYGDLALEDAALEVFVRDASGWSAHSEARSGYHGSFRLHLPPGVFKITATGKVKMGSRDVLLAGDLCNLIVGKGEKRKDRIIIRLEKSKNQQW